jgi:PAS domain S-box-containing protein
MPESMPQLPMKKVSLRMQVFITFAIFVVGASIGVYNLLIYITRQQVNELVKTDLLQVLEAASEDVDLEMLFDLVENGEPNADGFSDDPRYLALLDTLDDLHRIEPDAWPYIYIPGDTPKEIIFVVDLIARYEPERAASFLETYWSNSGYILIGLDRQTFREVDAPFVQAIRNWGDHTNWVWLKNGLHGLAYGLADWGIFPKRDFGIYEDRFGRWASGYMPIKDENGNRVAAIGVDFKAELIESAYYQSHQIIIWIYLVFAINTILILIGFLRRLIDPLGELTRIASNIRQETPETEKSFLNFSKVRTVGEIEILAEVLEEMVEQIRHRERRYQAVINAQDSLIVRTTPEGKFSFSNQAYDELRGPAKPSDLASLTGENYHPDDRQEMLRFISGDPATITVDDPIRKHQVRVYDQKGNLRWYQWTVTGIFNDQDELTEVQSVGQDITELKDFQYELEKANQRLREISHDLFNAAEQERNKIAREVHDDMLNYISELVLTLEGDIPAKIVNQTYKMIADRLRETVYDLRPPMLAYGLNFGLKDYVTNLSERLEGTAFVNFYMPENAATYPKDVDVHLFRIVQQACENAVEHARSENITISGELNPGEIHLVVEDDGVGFNWNSDAFVDDSIGQNRFGLAGMIERGLIVGADVEIISERGNGTRVEINWREEDFQQIIANNTPSNELVQS